MMILRVNRKNTRPQRATARISLACAGLLGAGLIACKDTSAPKAEVAKKAQKPAAKPTLVVYSGRKKALVGPLLDKFAKAQGIDLKVKYGKTAPLAATLLEEKEAGKLAAQVFFAQDAGSLGLLAQKNLLKPLAKDTLNKVAPAYQDKNGLWVGVSGRVRTVVFHNKTQDGETLPKSLADLTKPEWKGKVGWAPGNASFQAHVTAMRVLNGEEATKKWLEGMVKNETKVYPKNTPIVDAASRHEIEVGLVNHYYLHKLQANKQAENADNYYLPGETMVNVAGVGILNDSPQATALVNFLLSDEAQKYFAEKTYEYPLLHGVAANKALPSLESLNTAKLDLSAIYDLQGTLELLRSTGALP